MGTKPEGYTFHNADYDVMQICLEGQWKALGVFGCPDGDGCPDPCDPSESPTPGTTCYDGSIYVTNSPDGGTPMYTTTADQSSGAYWGADNFVTGSTSPITGSANSADVYAHVLAGDGGANPDNGDTPNAFVICEELTAHNHSDWYLPAEQELYELFTYQDTGDLNGTFESGITYYWSSTEASSATATSQRFDFDQQINFSKDYSGGVVRCVRKD